MSIKRIVDEATSVLTEAERDLLALLTDGRGTKEDVVDFLNNYDIDNESAVSSFLINDLLDRFSLSKEDSPLISRIRGLKEYFHFHNATIMMNQTAKEVLFDIDLCLKVRFPDDIRPCTSSKSFSNRDTFVCLFGRRYTDRIVLSAVTAKLHNKEYMIPNDFFMRDIIYAGLYIATYVTKNRDSIIGNLYDVYRYCNDKNISMYLQCAATEKKLKNATKRRIEWLLK